MAGLYDKLHAVARPRRGEWRLTLFLALGAAMLIAMAVMLVGVCRDQYRYNNYRYALAQSVLYVQRHDSLVIYMGAEPMGSTLPPTYWDVMADMGRGKVLAKLPERPADLTVDYGDGSVTRLWQTDVADYAGGRGAEWKPGMVLCYDAVEGRQYAVDRGVDFTELQAWLLDSRPAEELAQPEPEETP